MKIRYDTGTLSLTVYHVFPGNLINYLPLKTELLHIFRGPQEKAKLKEKSPLQLSGKNTGGEEYFCE